MNIEDLRPGEQLTQLPAEPKVSPEMQSAFLGLMWPEADTLNRQASKSALADSRLVDGTVDWIEEVLKAEWVAPDLRRRLAAATGVISRRDAFLARYAIDKTKIQVIVTRFSIHLVFLPDWGYTPVEPLACANAFLNVQSDPGIPWTGGPWSTLPVDGFIFGYQRRTPFREWRDSLKYLSDGRIVKFSITKIPQQPERKPNKTGYGPSEQAESQWFESKSRAAIPKQLRSSRRDAQGAATSHKN
jgi:hypothetical protein